MNKYKTFGRRFWAAIMDMSVFVPMGWIDNVIWSNVKTPGFLAFWIVIHTAAFWLYGILLHGYFGQTVGKFVCNVKVLDKSEKRLSLKQAFYRDAIPVLVGIPLLGYQINNILEGNIENQGFPSEMNILLKAFLGFSVIWLLLELITMLTNKKRRAIHDFIAGSVVVRLDAENSPDEKKNARYRTWLFVALLTLFIADTVRIMMMEHLTRR